MMALLLALCLLLATLSALLAGQCWGARQWRGRHAQGEARLAAQAPMLVLLQALPVAVIGTDRHGVVRYLNARALALGGLPAAHGVGASVSQLLPLFHDGAAIDAARCCCAKATASASTSITAARRWRTTARCCCCTTCRRAAAPSSSWNSSPTMTA